MNDCDLDNPRNIVLWNISRIQKTESGCFHISKLTIRYQVKKNKIDVEYVIKGLINDGMIKNGNKKGVYCLTHNGKLEEHCIERLYNNNRSLRIIRK